MYLLLDSIVNVPFNGLYGNVIFTLLVMFVENTIDVIKSSRIDSKSSMCIWTAPIGPDTLTSSLWLKYITGTLLPMFVIDDFNDAISSSFGS